MVWGSLQIFQVHTRLPRTSQANAIVFHLYNSPSKPEASRTGKSGKKAPHSQPHCYMISAMCFSNNFMCIILFNRYKEPHEENEEGTISSCILQKKMVTLNTYSLQLYSHSHTT